MIELLGAVLFASLLGSLHCVGMCGPFAMLAVANTSRTNRKQSDNADGNSSLKTIANDQVPESNTASQNTASQSWMNRCAKVSCYHLGRWTTYLIIGLVMGTIGLATDSVADWWGMTNIAAKAVGLLMIAMGLYRLRSIWLGSHRIVAHSPFWLKWNQSVLRAKKRFAFESPYVSAYSWGLVSTWLPCGWLYVFAIAAAGTGGIASAVMLMTAFWVGTLPLLSAISLGTSLLGTRVQRHVQPVAAAMLIAFGVLTLFHRTSVDFGLAHANNVLAPSHVHDEESSGSQSSSLSTSDLDALLASPLPCCEKCLEKAAKAKETKSKD